MAAVYVSVRSLSFLLFLFCVFTSGPFKSIANSGTTDMVKYWPATSKNAHWIRNGVIANVCVENQRHRNRELYAVKRMTCVLDLSCSRTRTHFIVSMRLTMNEWMAWYGWKWCAQVALTAEKKSKPFTINSYFDGFYKIYTVKQMV